MDGVAIRPRPPQNNLSPQEWVEWFNANYLPGTSVGFYWCETDTSPKGQTSTGSKAKLAKNGKPVVYLKSIGWMRLEDVVPPVKD